jgi:tetratricopeptide (TPR) repeat protein
MKNCAKKDNWNLSFDVLSDEEFDELVAHAIKCNYHASLLDEYSKCTVPLMKKVAQHDVELAKPRKVFERAFNLLADFVSVKVLAIGSVSAVIALCIYLLIPANLNMENAKMWQALLTTASACFILLIFSVMLSQRKLALAGNNGAGGEILPFDEFEGSRVGKSPEKLQPKCITEEEKKISAKIRKILKSGFTPDNCKKCLSMLAEHESLVERSWIQTLNKVRFLKGIGEHEEAERLLQHVMKEFDLDPEAMAMAFEIRSWFEELAYNEAGQADADSLDRRLRYVYEGLNFNPENHQLWINAFETHCQKKNTEDALFSLKKLVEIDLDIARKYFADNPKTSEIMKMSSGLKSKIASIIGRRKMKTYSLTKLFTLIVGVIVTLALYVLVSGSALNGIAGDNGIQQLADSGGTSTTYAVKLDSARVSKATKGTSTT